MGRSQETFSKKENEKKRRQKRKEKELRRDEKKQTTAGKGKSLEDMLAYVDENGNISTVPPDPKKLKAITPDEVMISTPKMADIEDANGMRTGRVSYYNDSKGYGFIADSQTGERVFLHINDLDGPVSVDDRVEYKVKSGPRGLQAEAIKKITNT